MIRWYGPKLSNTRIMPFFVSLLACNVLQAIGTLMNSKWVAERTVSAGLLCSVQAGIKQTGNLGIALWYVPSFPYNLGARGPDVPRLLDGPLVCPDCGAITPDVWYDAVP